MCHVSSVNNKPLNALSIYTDKCVEEFTILTSYKLKPWLEQKNIAPIGFN